jgi:hypothetical protein
MPATFSSYRQTGDKLFRFVVGSYWKTALHAVHLPDQRRRESSAALFFARRNRENAPVSSGHEGAQQKRFV